jgi:hypothetical protein
MRLAAKTASKRARGGEVARGIDNSVAKDGETNLIGV